MENTPGQKKTGLSCTGLLGGVQDKKERYARMISPPPLGVILWCMVRHHVASFGKEGV